MRSENLPPDNSWSFALPWNAANIIVIVTFADILWTEVRGKFSLASFRFFFQLKFSWKIFHQKAVRVCLSLPGSWKALNLQSTRFRKQSSASSSTRLVELHLLSSNTSYPGGASTLAFLLAMQRCVVQLCSAVENNSIHVQAKFQLWSSNFFENVFFIFRKDLLARKTCNKDMSFWCFENVFVFIFRKYKNLMDLKTYKFQSFCLFSIFKNDLGDLKTCKPVSCLKMPFSIFRNWVLGPKNLVGAIKMSFSSSKNDHVDLKGKQT